MKILVTYMSQTGNTKKVAEAIFQEIKGKKEIKPMDEVSNLDDYGLVFIGFPIQATAPAAEAKSFLELHSRGKNVALFVTHGAPDGSPQIKEWLDKCKAAATDANIIGVFDCQGELNQAMADFMLNSGHPRLVEAAKRRPLTIGQPDATRLKRARNFAREIVNHPTASCGAS